MLELPRIYLNGFPKSGLHLAELMVGSVFHQAFPDHNWYGTNAWTTESKNLDKLAKLAIIQKGSYLKGHSGYTEEMKDMLIGLEVGMVFVYRDLRDVAVSQTYHILSNKEELLHPGREYYPDDFDEVLRLVISGNINYEGVIDRWNNYSEWMDKFWIYSVKYEEMLKRPEKAASRFFDYMVSLSLKQAGMDEIKMDKEAKNKSVKHMVENMKRTNTTTFRKGKVGQWRYEFKPEHVKLFKEHDTQNVLMKLGFEKNRNWN